MVTLIQNLIDANKDATKFVENLEQCITNFEIKTAKDKADFGNLCIALRGFRMIKESTESMLYNANIIISDYGEYFQKIDDINDVPMTEKGNDFDKDKSDKENNDK